MHRSTQGQTSANSLLTARSCHVSPSLQALDKFLQTEKHSLAPVPPIPSPVHLSQAHQEMAFW